MKAVCLPLVFLLLASVSDARSQAEPTPFPSPNDIPATTPSTVRTEDKGAACPVCSEQAKTSGPLQDAESTLAQLEQDWGEAIVRHDVDFLERIEADDYTYTGPDGALTHKADEIAGAKAAYVQIDSFKHTDIKVHVYGDSAVVTGATALKAKAGDIDLSGDFRWTDVFVKQNGRWQVVASQATSISKPPAEN